MVCRSLNKQAESLREMARGLMKMADDLDRSERMLEGHESCQCNAENSFVQGDEIGLDQDDNGFDRLAEKIYLHRRRRNLYFPSKIFSDPTWDILLDLFVQNSRNRLVSVTSACIAGDTPTTTGLRWIKILEMEGLVEREGSERDARITWLRLTPKAMEQMTKYFAHGVDGVRSSMRDRLTEPTFDIAFK